MTETMLAIDRLSLGYEAVASFARAEAATRRITATLARHLPDALARLPPRAFGEVGEGFVFVDRLDLRAVVATHWPEEEIAARLAGAISRALAQSLARGEAMLFRDRAELVAADAATLLDQGSGGRWWFAEFDGLAMLPPGQRLCTLLLREGIAGFAALARLPADRRHALVARLSEADLARLELGLPDGVFAAPPAAVLADAIAVALGAAVPADRHRALALLIHLAGASGTEPLRPAMGFAALMLALVRAAQAGSLPPAAADPALTLARWLEAIGAPAADAALVRLADPAALVAIVAAHAAQGTGQGDMRAAEEAFGYTPFGGALLLCVILERVGWWRDWQACLAERLVDEGEARRLAAGLALEVTARALDPRRAARIAADPVLQRVFRPDETWTFAAGRAERRLMAQAMGEAPSTGALFRADGHGFAVRAAVCARALLAAFATRVPGMDGATSRYVRRQLLDLPATVAGDGTQARLGKPPLDVLLMLSGLKRATASLPHGRTLRLSGLIDP